MLTDPESFEAHKDELDVDYVYMGYYENALSNNIRPYLSATYSEIFSRGGISVFDVRTPRP